MGPCRTCSSVADALADADQDLKPENLLYVTRDPNSSLVLADFGIAKMLDTNEVLTTMAGSFGYAAPEVMLKRGHGKAVDLWSLGVITYTLLCGYSPFRSENLEALIEECRDPKNPVFHPRYWNEVSEDAKDFIKSLLNTDPTKRPTSEVRVLSSSVVHALTYQQQALKHVWLTGATASDHDLLPELRAYARRQQMKRAVEVIKLANRIEKLKMQEDAEENVPGEADVPASALEAAGKQLAAHKPQKGHGLEVPGERPETTRPRSLSRIARGAIFREVVLAKVREMKEQERRETFEKEIRDQASKRSSASGK